MKITLENTQKSSTNVLPDEVTNRLTSEIATCAVANLRKATRVITQLYDEALQPLGLRSTQFTLISTIALNEWATINELADKLVMDRTTLARDLKPLEREGLLEVKVGKADGRTRQVCLTTKGRTLLLEAVPLRLQAQTKVEEALGNVAFRQLLLLLSELVIIGSEA